MFWLHEVRYQLRNAGRTLLTFAVSAMLLCAMAFFLGNLRANETALSGLAQQIEVPVAIRNGAGTRSIGLSINTELYDALASSEVHDMRGSASAVASFAGIDPENDGVDTSISAANHIDQFAGIPAENVDFAEGCGPDFLAGEAAACIALEKYADLHGIALGDTIELPIYFRRRNDNGTINYIRVGKQKLQVIGIYHADRLAGVNSDGTALPDLYVPVQWLREAAKSSSAVFRYESASAVLDDPMRLNEFKEGMKAAGFQNPTPTNYTDNVLSVSDGLFIRTARELRRNIVTFRNFLLPFFLLVIALSTLSIFLILRSSRLEIAVSSSLGRPKWKSAAVRFFTIMLLAFLACCAAFPLMLFAGRIAVLDALTICGAFLLCTAVGTVLALVLLLRFNTLELLTKVD